MSSLCLYFCSPICLSRHKIVGLVGTSQFYWRRMKETWGFYIHFATYINFFLKKKEEERERDRRRKRTVIFHFFPFLYLMKGKGLFGNLFCVRWLVVAGLAIRKNKQVTVVTIYYEVFVAGTISRLWFLAVCSSFQMDQ